MSKRELQQTINESGRTSQEEGLQEPENPQACPRNEYVFVSGTGCLQGGVTRIRLTTYHVKKLLDDEGKRLADIDHGDIHVMYGAIEHNCESYLPLTRMICHRD